MADQLVALMAEHLVVMLVVYLVVMMAYAMADQLVGWSVV
jgi:hypothetical protein